MEIENIFNLLLVLSFFVIGYLTYNLFKIGRKNTFLEEKNSSLDYSINELKEKLKEKIDKINLLNNTIEVSKDTHSKTSYENDNLMSKNAELSKKVNEYEALKDERLLNYGKRINALNETIINLKSQEEKRIIDEKEKEDEKRKLNERTWQNWEATVENRIRLICDDNTLKYISQEDYPSTKKPDNSIEIANQFIIFDAKSPKSHDKLHAFKTTITSSINKMDKYSGDKTLDVSKDMYLVLPQVAIDMFDSKYNKGDYTVHVVGLDALNPIILSLSKLQNYFTADKLSPEEKENLSRYIGTSNNMLKRVSFINNKVSQAINEHVIKSDYLPKDISEKSKEHEKGHQLNITNQQKGGSIALETLVDETKKISLLNSINTIETKKE